MSFEKIDITYNAEIANFGITGGEPTMVPYFSELVNFITIIKAGDMLNISYFYDITILE